MYVVNVITLYSYFITVYHITDKYKKLHDGQFSKQMIHDNKKNITLYTLQKLQQKYKKKGLKLKENSHSKCHIQTQYIELFFM